MTNTVLFAGFQRLKDFALDSTQVFLSLDNLKDYIKNDKTAYAGQQVAVIETKKLYSIFQKDDGSLYYEEILNNTDYTNIINQLLTITNNITNLQTEVNTKTNAEYVNDQITQAVAKLIADAPANFDTLKEIYDWISKHQVDYTNLVSLLKNYELAADATDKYSKILARFTEDETVVTKLTARVATNENSISYIKNNYCTTTELNNRLANIDELSYSIKMMRVVFVNNIVVSSKTVLPAHCVIRRVVCQFSDPAITIDDDAIFNVYVISSDQSVNINLFQLSDINFLEESGTYTKDLYISPAASCNLMINTQGLHMTDTTKNFSGYIYLEYISTPLQ
jgi:hypothetical protein